MVFFSSIYLQKMTDEQPAVVEATEEMQLNEVMAPEKLPQADTIETNEIVQVDDWLNALRNMHTSEIHKYTRRLKYSDRKLQKKDTEIESLKKELAARNTDLAVTKAQLLGDLLNAERKIKHLEHECNDAKDFVSHNILVASERISQLIRLRYGDGKVLNLMNGAPGAPAKDDKLFEVPSGHEDISASSTLITVPVTDLDPIGPPAALPAVVPAAVPTAVPTTFQEQLHAEAEGSDDDVIVVENEQMETDECAVQFPCGKCTKTFDTMAQKFQHEKKYHDIGSATDVNEEDEEDESDDEESPKSAKRMRPLAFAKKMAAQKRLRANLLKALAKTYDKPDPLKMAPVMKQLKSHLRAKKLAAKNNV